MADLKTGDTKCWDALTAVSRRTSSETRLYFIRVARWPPSLGEPTPGHRECLRFLLQFLDVKSPSDLVPEDARKCRDLATFQLAKNFALIDWKIDPQTAMPLQSPREMSLLRDRVRELAESELARPSK